AATATPAGCWTPTASPCAAGACGPARPGCRLRGCSTWTSAAARWNAGSACPPCWSTPPEPASTRSPCPASTRMTPSACAATSPARWNTMTTTPGPAPAGAVELPTAHERRLHPLSWLFVLVSSIGWFLVPQLALVILGGRSEDNWQLAAAGAGVLALVAGAVWRYFTWRYRIGSDSLFVRSGLLERSLRQIPFSRIHDVSVHQTLLHRLFDVAEVRLESASGDKPEARMQVLRLDEALALEQLIRRGGEIAVDPPVSHAGPAGQGELLLRL